MAHRGDLRVVLEPKLQMSAVILCFLHFVHKPRDGRRHHPENLLSG